MKKKPWLAHPWLSGLLGVTWLLLQQSVEPFHLLSALLIGLILPRMLHGFLPQGARINIKPALALTGVVLWDIVMSNIAVARLVLGPISRMQPGWVVVPLKLRNPTAISLFATIITTTPGTVSCTVDEGQWVILVHALDCSDAPQMAADMKARYEQPLMAIFESTQPLAGDKA
jgi:multicomponent K+:H+ antiporter subunit E